MTSPDPTPSSGRSPRAIASLVLVLVAIVGIAAGVALDRSPLLGHRGGRRGPPGMMPSDSQRTEMRRRGLDRLAGELSLSADQKSGVGRLMAHHDSTVDAMMRETGPRFRALRDSLDTGIEAILTPAQQGQFRKWREERERRPRFGGPPPRD